MKPCAAWLVSGVIVLIGGPNITDAIRKDKAALQGTWKIIGSENKGEKVPENDLKDLFLIFRGDAILVREGGKTQEKFSYLLDPSKKPKEIDLVFTDGPKKGRADRAIYHLDADNLRICIQENKDGPRPREFGTRKDSHLSVVTLQRMKK